MGIAIGGTLLDSAVLAPCASSSFLVLVDAVTDANTRNQQGLTLLDVVLSLEPTPLLSSCSSTLWRI